MPAALAAVLIAAAGVAGVQAPAQAAVCAPGTGNTVVVDFGALGGGKPTACVGDVGGKNAWDVVEAAGFDLEGTQRFPNFVCRVAGKPAGDPCQNTPPNDAYWGLFWSKGDGNWIYASQGAASLEVPKGGWIGFAWQDGGERDLPGVTPGSAPEPTKSPTAKPSKSPTAKPSVKPSDKPTTPAATSSTSPSAQATETSAPTTDASAAATEVVTESPSGSPDEQPTSTAEPSAGEPADLTDAAPTAAGQSEADGRNPTGWVAPILVAALLVAAGVLLIRRRMSQNQAGSTGGN